MNRDFAKYYRYAVCRVHRLSHCFAGSTGFLPAYSAYQIVAYHSLEIEHTNLPVDEPLPQIVILYLIPLNGKPVLQSEQIAYEQIGNRRIPI